MAELTRNFAVSTVATAPSPATSGTSLVVAAGEGTRFDGAVDFNAVVCPADAQPTPSNAEIVRVTAISTDTFTIVRAQEGSGARSIVVGDRIYAGPTVKTFSDLEAVDGALFGAVAGAVAKSLMDVKGDMYAASAADGPDRFGPVGANETAIVAASAEAVGMKWAVPLGALSAPTLLSFTSMQITAGQAAPTPTTFGATVNGGVANSGGAGALQGVFPLVGADYSIAGRVTKIKVTMVLSMNATDPTIDFTGGLSLLSAPGGGANAITTSWGEHVAGTTVTRTTTTASTRFTDSVVFTAPADGVYVPTIEMSGAMPATNPKVQIWLLAYVYHTAS